MPWDGTELRWAPFDPRGRRGRRRSGWPGGPTESVIQPTWTAGGGLLASSDRTGWWNVYRFTGADLVLDEPEALTPIDAEIGGPHWVFGQSWFAVLPDDTLVVSLGADGLQAVGVVAPGTGRVERLGDPVHRGRPARAPAGAAEFAMVAAGPAHESTPLRCRFAAEGALETEELRPARDLGFDPATFSAPEPVEFPTSRRSHRPRAALPADQPRVVGRAGRAAAAARAEPRRSHLGGPADPRASAPSSGPAGASRSSTSTTAGAPATAAPTASGSNGTWGIVDVDDCVAAAEHLAAEGIVDRERLAIRGGSAGGYTTLCALAFHDTFAAGASHYGVADSRPWPATPTSSSPATSTASVGPYPDEATLPASARRSTTPTASPARSSSSRASRTRWCRPRRPR